MRLRYGIPYQGSKNKIAKDIIEFLPEAEYFVDLFAGGCAITQAAAEKTDSLIPKWKKVVCNDINEQPLSLFKKAVSGELNNEKYKKWINRETFFREKETDSFMKYCWSFANNGVTYIYSEEIEPWKKAFYYATEFNDFQFIQEILGNISSETKLNFKKWIKENNEEIKNKYFAWYKKKYSKHIKMPSSKSMIWCENIGRLIGLRALKNSRGMQNIVFCNKDYKKISIPESATVYADIPYENTKCGSYSSFDNKAFYNWALEQKFIIYISSYEITDNRFETVWEKEKIVSYKGKNLKKIEHIYIQKKICK